MRGVSLDYLATSHSILSPDLTACFRLRISCWTGSGSTARRAAFLGFSTVCRSDGVALFGGAPFKNRLACFLGELMTRLLACPLLAASARLVLVRQKPVHRLSDVRRVLNSRLDAIATSFVVRLNGDHSATIACDGLVLMHGKALYRSLVSVVC